MDNEGFELFARCASGFEQVLAQELKDMRLRRVRPLQGGVSFFGTKRDAYLACLWSRVATRIQLVLARVPAGDADRLFEGVSSFAWEQVVRRKATVAVEAHGTNASLRNTTFTALKVKDALCDRLRAAWGERPDVDPKHPDLAVNVALHQNRATLYLNLSGASLHRRGYRTEGVQTAAPLKETLAAGILLAAGWPRIAREGGVLVDPMCGSGTFAVEAALMAADVAPGMLRDAWGFEGWAAHDESLWAEVVAVAAERAAGARPEAHILAGDVDARALEVARDNVAHAQVRDLVQLYRDDAARLDRHLRGLLRRGAAKGLLVTNPPYGHRLLGEEDLPEVADALAQAASALPAGWRMAVVTPDAGLDTALGRIPSSTIACHNGPLQVWVRLYELDGSHGLSHQVVSLSGTQRSVSLAEQNSAQFAARLRKVAKERLRQATRDDTSCMRVYDADLPDYALSVDLYLGVGPDEGRRYAVVCEHRRPARIDAQRANRRLSDAVALVSAVLDVPRRNVLMRGWDNKESHGGRKPARPDPLELVVRECGHLFPIDLNGRPDTGLPLELRGVRQLVGSRAKGRRCVSLFDASVAAGVYMAAAPASRLLVLDAYADRAKAAQRMLEANRAAGKNVRVSCEDARLWLHGAKGGDAYDLIVCVPPAWMPPPLPGQPDWERQRDTAALLKDALAHLSKRGLLVFACADKGFSVDVRELESWGASVEDVSQQVVPDGFERSARSIRCYLLYRGHASA